MGGHRFLTAVVLVVAVGLAWPALAPAATLSISQGQHAALVFYTAAPGETNNVQISLSGGSHWDVSDTGAPIDVQGPTSGQYGYCKSVDTHHAYCTALGAMANFRVHLGDGNDRFVLNAGVDTQTEDVNEIWGDAGNDYIETAGWIEFLHGGDGNDTLYTKDKYCDRMHGDAGNDTFKTRAPLQCFSAQQTEFDGGTGIDTADFSNRGESIVATANSPTYPGIEDFIGGNGNDALTGDDGRNLLVGGNGNDVLRGMGGDDILDPGYGQDVVSGGAGTDLATYAGRPTALKVSIDGVGNDGKPPTQHYTGEHDNVETDVENVTGGNGNDTIVGSDPHRAGRTPAVGGQNVLTGGPGNDVIDGGGGSDTLVGGTGDDQLRSRDGAADVDNCGAGSDTANADTQDTFVGCELVSRSAAVAFGGGSGFDRRFLLPAALVLVAGIAASRLSAWLRRSRKRVFVSPS